MSGTDTRKRIWSKSGTEFGDLWERVPGTPRWMEFDGVYGCWCRTEGGIWILETYHHHGRSDPDYWEVTVGENDLRGFIRYRRYVTKGTYGFPQRLATVREIFSCYFLEQML